MHSKRHVNIRNGSDNEGMQGNGGTNLHIQNGRSSEKVAHSLHIYHFPLAWKSDVAHQRLNKKQSDTHS